jgi:PKD repeat protein
MGTYDVTLTVSNNAGQSKKYKPGFIQVGPAGIPDISAGNFFSITPNPAVNGQFSILFGAPSSYEVKILSGMATLIERQTTDSKEILFNLPGMANGLYFVQVKDLKTGLIHTQKLIIQ